MECYTYLRNVTDLLSDGKTPYERRFGQPSKRPIIPFGSLVEYHPITAKDQSRIHQFGKKVLPGLFLGYALYAGRNLEGWRTDRRPWGVGNDGRIGNLLEKTRCERGDISQAKRNYFFNRRWTNQNPGGDQELRTSTLVQPRPIQGEGHIDFLGESEGSLPQPHDSLPEAGEANERFLVHVGKLHIPPSRWTTSRTLLAERRIIPYSTQIHWRHQNYSYEFGCQAREAHWWLLEHWWFSRLVWSLDRFHTIHSSRRKSSLTDICGRERD